MLGVSLLFAVFALVSASPLDSNLAYRSPFVDKPQVSQVSIGYRLSSCLDMRHQLGYDTRSLHKRMFKRQMEDAKGFVDKHYPTFFGSDFSNVRRFRISPN